MAEGTRIVALPTGGEALSLEGARLVVRKGPDRGRTLDISKQETVIGAASSADLVLTDPTVSRNHALLTAGENGFVLRDLESTNGVWLAGRRLFSACIAPGDDFDLGSTRVRLEAAKGRVELPLSQADTFGGLLGSSASARRLFALLESVTQNDSTVLLLGETGTGKDTCAEAIHSASARADRPFVVVDCGAVAEGIIESELFGHEKGAFSGAHESRTGAFEEAAGGTIFLDEVGELPRALQLKLLRAIDRREVRPIGSNQVVKLDVRIVAATNRDLRLDVNSGLFREDLFYRLNVVSIRVPALRERMEDVPLLANHFFRQLTGDPEALLPEEVLTQFAAHRWPGNIRELRNRVERVAVLKRAEPISTLSPVGSQIYREAKAAAVEAFERQFLTELLGRARGNVSEAARLAQMDRVFLSKLLRKQGLK